MAETKVMYEHTWYGQPAVWVDSEKRIRVRFPRERRKLVASLRTIEAHQRADAAMCGWIGQDGDYDREGYGFVRVRVPSDVR